MFSIEDQIAQDVKSRWLGLKDALEDEKHPIWLHFATLSADEKDTLRKEYAKDRDRMAVIEAWPREAATLPCIFVEERNSEEPSQYLGQGADYDSDEALGTFTVTRKFRIRKTISLELITKNKDTTKHLFYLLRFIVLSARTAWDAPSGLGFLQQRIQTYTGTMREEPLFPEENFTRTLLLSFEMDEVVADVEKVPIISSVETVDEGATS